jgi:hypothetical protein
MGTVALVSVLVLLCPVLANRVQAAPTSDNLLLRVDVEKHGEESVKISVPLSLLDVVFEVLPGEIREMAEKTGLRPEKIREELATVQGQDLVRVKGEDNIRVWIESVAYENRKDLEFVRVHVQESGEHAHEIDVCLPRGLVQLAGGVIRALGLTEKMELPPIVKEMTKHGRSE